MRQANVILCVEDSLPDLSPDDPEASVWRVLTDNPDKEHDELYIDPVQPPPWTGALISYDIKRGFLSTKTVAVWGTQTARQRDYSHASGNSVGGALY